MLKIMPVRALKDNYIWMVVNEPLREVLAVDPGETQPVLDFLNKHHLTLTGILITHKHADHTGGIPELLKTYKNIPVYAHRLENIASTTHVVEHDGVVNINNWPATSFKVIYIPGHTMGHVAYYAKPIVFTGDTLFGAGCGRVFEGTPEQMLSSLNKLAALPDETFIYCGHEYTLANLRFAQHVEPDNKYIQERIKQVEELLAKNLPSLPSTMEMEKKTNPFLRCEEKSIITSVENHAGRKLADSVEVFHQLREWKNKF